MFLSLAVTPLLAFAHGTVVGKKRRAAGIHYPQHYATPQETKASPAALQFNCAQRAHGQFIENAPQTMLLMLAAGLAYPRATALLGAGWVASRIAYLVGYVYSGSPSNRRWGAGFWFCQLGLVGLCAKMAWDLK